MLLQLVVYGITMGSTFALVAMGWSLVFGVLELINFAHGAFVLAGAYLSILFIFRLGLPFAVGVLLAMTICGLCGYLMERSALRQIRKRGQSPIAALICTVGFAMVIDNLLIVVFGSEPQSFPDALNLGTFRILDDVIVPWLSVIIMCVTLAMMVILMLIIYKTEFGAAMRATSQNRRAASLMGINVNSIIGTTFFLGTFCAALAGALVGMSYTSVDTGMSFQLGIKTFAAAVLGGIGNLPAAIFGGLVIGIIESLVVGYIGASYRDVVAFAVLVLVLFIKPTGLFGKEALKKV